MTAYYFDTLPVHPQPAYLESLTSYLTRLAEANGLATIRHLFKLCFPTGPVRLSFQTGDFPPASFGGLPTLTQCTEERLLATTFYHLGKKFNRVLQPRPLAQFLSGGIAYRFLRYCPLCVAERGYYSLLWRFLVVEGLSGSWLSSFGCLYPLRTAVAFTGTFTETGVLSNVWWEFENLPD